MPCVSKPIMSSSGKGQSPVRFRDDPEAAREHPRQGDDPLSRSRRARISIRPAPGQTGQVPRLKSSYKLSRVMAI